MVLGEGGRVEDDEVVGVGGHPFEEGEHILADGVVSLRKVAAHKLHVLLHEVDSLLGNVHGINVFRTVAKSVEGEAAGVGEHVEHALAFRELAHHGATVALVEEEAGLLSVLDVDFEENAIFHADDITVGMTENPALVRGF